MGVTSVLAPVLLRVRVPASPVRSSLGVGLSAGRPPERRFSPGVGVRIEAWPSVSLPCGVGWNRAASA